MGENSKIEWTDHTFNPWRGCSKVSAGCDNCYADTMSKRNPGMLGIWGPNGSRVVASEEMWKAPLKWNARARGLGTKPRVFCASLADVFENWNGPVFDSNGVQLYQSRHHAQPQWWLPSKSQCDGDPLTIQHVRERLFELIDRTPNLDWLLLTKRPENICRMIPTTGCSGDCAKCYRDGAVCRARKNVWLGTSVENQEAADKRIPELLKCRDLSPVLFLSCEPLLGPVNLRVVGGSDSVFLEGHYRPLLRINALEGCTDPIVHLQGADCLPAVDWVIAGGESCRNARPMHPDWARSLRDQCQVAGVPFLFKQWGDWHPECSANWATGPNSYRYGKVEGVAIIGDGRTVLRSERESPAGKTAIVNPMLNSLSIKELKDLGYQWMQKVGKSKAGRLLDGREWNEFPKVEVANAGL